MTKYTSLAIALTATTFWSAPAIAAPLTPTLEENSVFSYSEGSENDYNFSLQEPDADGKLTTKYYKIDLKPEAFSTSKNVRWLAVGEDEKDAADVVAVQLPNNQTKYFKYTYTQPEGRTVYNTRQDALSGDIDAYFSDSNSSLDGGAVFNGSAVGNITGDFVKNYTNSGDSAEGGAIYNNENAVINDITGSFITNSAKSNRYYAEGGAIYNNAKAKIGNITGDFINNSAYDISTTGGQAKGGAISNYGIISKITGNFIMNHITGTHSLSGSAIYSRYAGSIGDINGNFIGNFISSAKGWATGAIYTEGTIGNITGDFIGNYALGPNSLAGGGAISNNIDSLYENEATMGNVTGDFIGNYVHGKEASGGAIYNHGPIGNITGNFLNNHAKISTGANLALGGAIWSDKSITFTSVSNTHFISGNYTQDDTRGKNYNSLFVRNSTKNPVITFDTAGGGAWVINDNIEGQTTDNYHTVSLALRGDDTIDASVGTTTQYIAINNDIINMGTVTVEGTTLKFGAYQHDDQTAKNWDGKGAFVAALNEDGTADRDADAVTSLSLNNAVFDLANGYLETVKLKGYSATDSFMHIDVDTDNMKADELHIAGNVEGVTKLIVHASSDADIRGKGEILFAQSENDTTGNEGSFVVSRVYKSPYLFDVLYNNSGFHNEWSLVMNDQPNEEPKEPEEPDVPTPPTPELPDIPPVKPQPLPGSDRPVAPEVIGAESLPAAALAQNSNMVYNIMNKVSANRLYCPGCGFYDYYWNGEAFHNLWANAVYNTLRIKTPTDIDAEVWGLEAGGDLQHDLNNKLGLFLSYRKGNYDMNGDGKHHYSTVGSEIDIDSYLAGLYYRYDRNNWWTFATVYGGIQRVDLKTKDGIKSDTDGTEFGGSVELGYDYAINKTVYLTPSVGAFYTQVDYDDATDSAGKIAKYNTLRQLELEAGVKLTKAFVTDEGYANVYVKPSVVRTVADGDEVNITGLGKVNTLDDQTLGRVEIGGRYGFTEQLSAYGWANHTFGSGYKATAGGLGLAYTW